MALAVAKIYGPAQQIGSGVIVNPQGAIMTILTVMHVVQHDTQPASHVTIEWNGTCHTAMVVGNVTLPHYDGDGITLLRLVLRRRVSLVGGLVGLGVLLLGLAALSCQGLLSLAALVVLLIGALYIGRLNASIAFTAGRQERAGTLVRCTGYPQGVFTSREGSIDALHESGELDVSLLTQDDPEGYSGGAVSLGSDANATLMGIICAGTKPSAPLTRLYIVHHSLFSKALQRQRCISYIPSVVCMIGAILAAVVALWQPCLVSCPGGMFIEEIDTVLHRLETMLLAQGEYAAASKQLQCLQGLLPQDQALQRLAIDLAKPLDMEIHLRLPEGERTVPLGQTVTMHSGARFQLVLLPSDTSYVYIYAFDTHAGVMQLFPHRDIVVSNPLAAATPHLLPAHDHGYRLDQHRGQEHLYFVATRWPAMDLTAAFVRWQQATSPVWRRVYRRQLLQRLKIRAQAQAAAVTGIFYMEYAFQHE